MENKVNMNKTKYNDIILGIKNILKTKKFHDKVAVEIYGKLVYLKEAEIRALQIIAAYKAKISKEEFEDFIKNVIVYSNRWKTNSKHTMIFREDGIFSNEFEPGFYEVCSHLTFKLL